MSDRIVLVLHPAALDPIPLLRREMPGAVLHPAVSPSPEPPVAPPLVRSTPIASQDPDA